MSILLDGKEIEQVLKEHNLSMLFSYRYAIQCGNKEQLKKIVGLLKACGGELVSRNNKSFMATFEMPVEVYQEMLKEIEL